MLSRRHSSRKSKQIKLLTHVRHAPEVLSHAALEAFGHCIAVGDGNFACSTCGAIGKLEPLRFGTDVVCCCSICSRPWGTVAAALALLEEAQP